MPRVDSASYHGSISELDAAYAAEMVRQEVVEKFGLKAYTEGYTAITTLDSKLQSAGVKALQAGIMAYDQRHGYRGTEQAAVAEEEWEQTLRDAPVYGGLEPAISHRCGRRPSAVTHQRRPVSTFKLGRWPGKSATV